MWGILDKKVYKNASPVWTTQNTIKWSGPRWMRQNVIAAAIRHWSRRLSVCYKSGDGNFEHSFDSNTPQLIATLLLLLISYLLTGLCVFRAFGPFLLWRTFYFAKKTYWLAEVDICCINSFATTLRCCLQLFLKVCRWASLPVTALNTEHSSSRQCYIVTMDLNWSISDKSFLSA